ncbi:MAG: class I tRNA ligase family protein [Bacilli bacterium]|nr:class I tRNA ligase family protein [Bacilli bacterium]
MNYNFSEIEKKWQKKWEEEKSFVALNDGNKEKFYVLVEFPYPSGAGLHVGHVRSYTALDSLSRLKRAQGYNVLFPMGWDAFGAPAEQYAIKNKVYPANMVKDCIKTFKSQIKSLGSSFDWSREFATTDPEYYKWTQWQFLEFYKEGLAYKAEKEINWCQNCKTGLSNEDAAGGVCERCGSPTTKKLKNQWMLKMSAYADSLIEGLDDTEFLDKIKTAQINWIGKSIGAEVSFKLKEVDDTLTVFTTRCDTLFGTTAMVLSPEHEFLSKYSDKIANIDEVRAYQEAARKKSEIERTDMTKEKTGVKIEGLTAINPANSASVEIWISDYVLSSYGTGAIMMVPAHDERDYEFAKKYDIPIVQVLAKNFEGTDDSAIRSDKPFTEREVVIAVIKHPTEDKYLCVKNNEFKWTNFVMGGIENKENTIEAAKREIIEETGYDDIEIDRELDFVYFDNFYARHKEVNRHITCHTVVGKLNSLNNVGRSSEEDELQEVMWVNKKDLVDTLSTNAHKYDASRILSNERAMTEDGIHINSGFLDGLGKEEAIEKMIDFLEENNCGKKTINYRLQDWIFSRQRFWGEPIPMIHCDECGWQPIPEEELPVILPDVPSYEPTDNGESPLSTVEEWVNTKCPKCGGPAKRETDTMPNWAGSSWYWIRYMDPKCDNAIADMDAMKYWGQVDLYNGGMEHATRHLLYARFWNQVLYNRGLVPVKEPFKKRVAHGMILGDNNEKMSKSRGNVVNPDVVIKNYGADALRTYEMFIGDYSKDASWSENGLKGCKKFLDRIYRLQTKLNDSDEYSKNLETEIHRTIKKVTDDIETMNYNTAVSALMILLNLYDKEESISKKDYRTMLQLLNPIAPHITEELNEMCKLGDAFTVSSWPKYDETKMKATSYEIGVQINGKLRASIEIEADEEENSIKEKAFNNENVKKYTEGKEIIKTIIIPNKIVSIVVK